MINVISWCNENQGFLSAILSVMTILVSVWALIISKKVGTIPYKKKLTVIPTYYEKNGSPIIDVLIVNYGFATLVIDYVYIEDKKGNCVGQTPTLKPIIIQPSKYKKIEVSIMDCKGLIQKNAIDLNNKMTINIREFGGKTHKFKKGFPVG